MCMVINRLLDVGIIDVYIGINWEDLQDFVSHTPIMLIL